MQFCMISHDRSGATALQQPRAAPIGHAECDSIYLLLCVGILWMDYCTTQKMTCENCNLP